MKQVQISLYTLVDHKEKIKKRKARQKNLQMILPTLPQLIAPAWRDSLDLHPEEDNLQSRKETSIDH